MALANQLNRWNYTGGSSYDPYSSSYNQYSLGNQPFEIGSGGGGSSYGQGQGGGTVGVMPPPSIGGAPNPAYQQWMQSQYTNPYAGQSSLMGQQIEGRSKLAAESWSRVMDFLKQMGIINPGGGGLSQGLQQFSGQTASMRSAPAIRSYENQKRTVANTIGGRGMGLSSAAENASAQAYGELARALSEAGTYGDVAAQGLQYGLLGDLLRFAGTGGM